MYKLIFSLLLGYLFGSLPFAVIVSWLKGINIREVGTKNPGAANVYREVGKPYGILVWILDTLKGVVPMIIANTVFHLPFLIVAASGSLAIAGHCWSIFLGFKGGKGVATMGGVTLSFSHNFPHRRFTLFLGAKNRKKTWDNLYCFSHFLCRYLSLLPDKFSFSLYILLFLSP
ncbi:MAG: glycerol-3-phosphate acyltransferase [Caldiserica bacterium]|nr:glycerol-3-phosphate acyltransferase [Caldisericota bacterium]